MTTNKKNTSLVAVLALFVALVSNVHAQTTTQPAQAPATPTVTIPRGIPTDIFQMMFGPMVQAPQVVTPNQFEDLYHQVWLNISAHYYNADALVAADWGRWEHAYDGKLLTDEDLDEALKAMVSSLSDRWTKYVSESEMEESSKRAADGIVSLGISSDIKTDGTIVISFLDFGSPAYRSALRVGDVLKAVDGKSLTGMTQEAVDELMTGKVGKDMTITYVRDGADANIKLAFAKPFKDKSEATLLPGRVLYLRLPEFDEKPYAAFEKAINDLKNKPGFEASFDYIVLDLRGNPGGDVNLALHMVETFVSSGIAYQQEERNGRVVDLTTKRIRPFLPFLGKDSTNVSVCKTALLQSKPMAVLVNGSSVSSAEIVTAALAGNHRATVVGTRTWGKAVAWNKQMLPNDGILLTTISGIKSPSGESWHGKGLTPDVVVEQPRDASVDVQLLKAIEVLTRGK